MRYYNLTVALPARLFHAYTQRGNVAVAIDRLCKAFGFEKHLVADAAASCDQTKAAGAEILLVVHDAHSNGRGCSCGDIDGLVWNCGIYDPRKRRSAPDNSGLIRRGDKLWRLTTETASLIAAATAVVLLGGALGASKVRDLTLTLDASASVGEEVTEKQLPTFSGERQAIRRDFSAASDHLDRERSVPEVAVAVVGDAEHLTNDSDGSLAKAETERELEDAHEQLARERSAREEAQRGTKETREHLSLAERAAETVQKQLAVERSARLMAEIVTQEVRQQLAKEHGAKEAAERALKKAHHHARAKLATARTLVDARWLSLSASPI
jgi:hypothetical protein